MFGPRSESRFFSCLLLAHNKLVMVKRTLDFLVYYWFVRGCYCSLCKRLYYLFTELGWRLLYVCVAKVIIYEIRLLVLLIFLTVETACHRNY